MLAFIEPSFASGETGRNDRLISVIDNVLDTLTREFPTIAFSAYFGAALTLLVYLLAHRIGAKLHHPLANPMLICLVIMLILLLVLDIDYDAYNQSAQYITYRLTPATACLAYN